MGIFEDILKAGGYVPREMTQNPFDNAYFRPQERGDGSESMGSSLGERWMDWSLIPDEGLQQAVAALVGGRDGVSGGGGDPQALLNYLASKGYRLTESADGQMLTRGLVGPDGKLVGDLQRMAISNEDAFWTAGQLAALVTGNAVSNWAAGGNGIGAAGSVGDAGGVFDQAIGGLGGESLPAGIESFPGGFEGGDLGFGLAGEFGVNGVPSLANAGGALTAAAGAGVPALSGGPTAAPGFVTPDLSAPAAGIGAGVAVGGSPTPGLSLGPDLASGVASGVGSAVGGAASNIPTWLSNLANGITSGKVTDWAGLLSSLYGLNMASNAKEEMDPFRGYRKGYAERLQALEANPSLITQSPGYQAGIDAIKREAAATGYYGSGNMALGLSRFAGDRLDRERDRLATLAGAGQSPGAGYPAYANLAGANLGNLGYIIQNWGK